MVTTLVSTVTLLWALWAPVGDATTHLQAMATPTVGQNAPEIRGKLMSGAEFDLAKKRGEVVLVDFWATWCEPCKLSLPRYGALEKKLASKGFSILTVSVDEDADALKRFIAATKLALAVLHDGDAKIVERYAPPKMPTAYLIGRDGKIAWTHESFVPGDEAKVEAAALQALSKAAP